MAHAALLACAPLRAALKTTWDGGSEEMDPEKETFYHLSRSAIAAAAPAAAKTADNGAAATQDDDDDCVTM